MPSASTSKQTVSEEFVYVGDQWYPSHQAKISVFDHGLLYGDGVYEGMRAYQNKVFKLEEHLARFERSCRCMMLSIPLSREKIVELISEGMQIHKLNNAYIRMLLTRGEGPIGPDPKPCKSPKFILILRDIPPLHGAGKTGIRVALSTVRRCGVDSATAQIKSLNYLPTILAKIEAGRLQVDDVIMLDARGFVAEAPVANVFIARGGRVYTPKLSSGVLEGVTRTVAIKLLQHMVIDVREQDLTPYDLSVAEEFFLTGTHAEIVSVTEYNGMAVGDGAAGPITTQLQTLFRKSTIGEIPI